LNKKLIIHGALLLLISLLSFYLFFFSGGEILWGIKNSHYWTHKIRHHRFYDSRGSIYLDKLDRSVSYKLNINITLAGHINVRFVRVDDKIDPSLYEVTKNGEGYNIKVFIPENEELDRAVVRIKLNPPYKVDKRYYMVNTRVLNAQLTPHYDISFYLKKLLLVVIAAAIGIVLHILLTRSYGRFSLSGFFFSAGIVMAVTAIISSFDFSFIYALGAKRVCFYIYYLFMIFFLTFPVLRNLINNRMILKEEEKSRGENRLLKHHKTVEQNDRFSKKDFFEKHKKYLFPAILFILLLTVSSLFLTNNFYIDDYLWLRPLSFKQVISSFYSSVDSTGCLPNYYRPLPLILLQVQYRIFGHNYVFYYLLRLLHIFLNCMIVYYICNNLTKKRRIAFFAVTIMALSMYSFSAMGWLSSFFSVLAIMFLLLSLYFYTKELNPRNCLWSFVFFLCALITKETAIMIPFIFVFFDLIFRAGVKIKNRIIFYTILLFTGGFYLLLRFTLWGSIAGMEAKHDFYSIHNMIRILIRMADIFFTFFTSPGVGSYEVEGVGGRIVRAIFIILILSALVVFSVKYLRDKKQKLVFRIFLAGLIWIAFLSLPILFPFDFSRLAYVLLPGMVLVIYSGFIAAMDRKTPGALMLIVIVFFYLTLAQQAVSNIRFGYRDYGMGANHRYAKNLSIYKTWKDKLPENVREFWHGQLRKEE